MSGVVYAMMDYQPPDEQHEEGSDARFWTLRRIILTIIIVITLIAFLVYVLLANYAFVARRPPPPVPTLEVQRG